MAVPNAFLRQNALKRPKTYKNERKPLKNVVKRSKSLLLRRDPNTSEGSSEGHAAPILRGVRGRTAAVASAAAATNEK